MKTELLPVVSVSVKPLLGQLVSALDELSAFRQAADHVLQKLVESSDEARSICDKLAACNARLIERLVTVDRSVTRVDIGGVSSSIRMLIDMESSTALSQAQVAQMKKLQRKLSSKFHPDRHPNPELFHLIRKAYMAKDFAVMSVYAMSIGAERPEEDMLNSLLKTTQRECDVYRSQPSFEILRLCQVGRRGLAVVRLVSLLSKKLADAEYRLLCYHAPPEEIHGAEHHDPHEVLH